MLNEFIEYLNGYVNRAIYCWGGQGQTATENLIRRKETSTANADRAVDLLNKMISAGLKNIKMFDCSGLAMYFLQDLNGIYKTDMNANALMGDCEKIPKNALRRGDWVFSTYPNGRAYHIGYVVDDELNVVESRGRAYGVVKRPLSAGNWNRYGRPNIFKTEIESQKRNLRKGDRGEDVREIQTKLYRKGYLTAEPDGIFGNATLKAVKSFQTDFVGTVDGIVGEKTKTALRKDWTFRATRVLKNTKPYMRGNDVVCLQEHLRRMGSLNVTPDGIFGDKTEAAVVMYQKFHGITPVDGIAGKKTFSAIGAKFIG